MAKNQTSSNSKGPCEKIFKAIHQISLSLPPDQKKKTSEVMSTDTEVPIDFGTSLILPTPEQTTKTNASEQRTGQGGHAQISRAAPNSEIPLTRVSVLEKAKPMEKAASRSGRGKVAEIASKKEPGEEGDFNDKFWDYIHRNKAKVATKEEHSSTAKAEDAPGEDGNVNHRFSNYIDRAKAKIRTTSNAGVVADSGGKSVSRLDSLNDKVSNFLNRAKIKMRTMSHGGGGGGGGKSVSIK